MRYVIWTGKRLQIVCRQSTKLPQIVDMIIPGSASIASKPGELKHSVLSIADDKTHKLAWLHVCFWMLEARHNAKIAPYEYKAEISLGQISASCIAGIGHNLSFE